MRSRPQALIKPYGGLQIHNTKMMNYLSISYGTSIRVKAEESTTIFHSSPFKKTLLENSSKLVQNWQNSVH